MRAAACPHTPLLSQRWCASEHHLGWLSRQAAPGRGDFWDGEEHRSGVGTRSALRRLTRRICPSAANEVTVARHAARPQAAHRSADRHEDLGCGRHRGIVCVPRSCPRRFPVVDDNLSFSMDNAGRRAHNGSLKGDMSAVCSWLESQ